MIDVFKCESKVNCLILSTGRAGSTAIYRYINEAGDLNLPINKEPHFLCDVNSFEGLYDGLVKMCVTNEKDYFDMYSNSEIILDASVGYYFSLDEVIKKLKTLKIIPKIILLYREPVSRAWSLYNELRKKQLTKELSVMDDIQKQRPGGLWWERYYDNVYYYNFFKIIDGYFKNILMINYDSFANDPKKILNIIFDFLKIKKKKDIDCCPINSSAEALLSQSKLLRPLKIMKYCFPASLWLPLKRKASLLMYTQKNTNENEIAEFLPNSIEQYKMFREYIGFNNCFFVER